MNRDEWLANIKPVAAFVAAKSASVEMLRSFAFKHNLVFASNGTSGMVSRCPVNLNCTVSADKFLSILERLPNEEVEILQKDDTLKIKCGKSTTLMQTGDAAAYPDFIPSSFVELGRCENLAEAVNFCVSAIDLTARNSFPGVCIRGKFAYSTDGLRATRYFLSADLGTELIYFPATSAKLFKRLPDNPRVIIWNNLFGLLFDDPPAMWFSATLAGKFPADMINNLLDAPYDPEYIATFPDGVDKAIDRLLIMLDESSEFVEMSNTSGSLSLIAKSRGLGEVLEVFDWDFQKPFSVKLNPRHFQEALRTSKVADLKQACTADGKHIRFYGQHSQQIMTLVS
jgi:DNA polymerase III sliding clamp (beta) subunit (PCNA family)